MKKLCNNVPATWWIQGGRAENPRRVSGPFPIVLRSQTKWRPLATHFDDAAQYGSPDLEDISRTRETAEAREQRDDTERKPKGRRRSRARKRDKEDTTEKEIERDEMR